MPPQPTKEKRPRGSRPRASANAVTAGIEQLNPRTPDERAARADTSNAWSFGGSGYFATQSSGARGQMVLFPQDTRRQLSPWARITLMLKSRVLVENYGPAKALWNLAALIGSLRAQARSGDTAWDALADAYFDRLANSPLMFDRRGKRTFATYQQFCTFRRFTDGDCFSVLTESTTGTPAVAGYEAHLCSNIGPSLDDSWIDGVQVTKDGFATRYRFTRPGGYFIAPEENFTLDSSALHHHATFTTLDGTRGTPALAHFINDAHDLIETKGFLKHAIKIASMIGLTRRADQGTPLAFGASAPIQSMPWQNPNLTGATPAVQGAPSTPTGTASGQPNMSFEEVVEAGLLLGVPMDTIHDDRPHPNGQQFKDSLLRECAIGLNFPPQILFYMDDPAGAFTRVILEMAARAVLDHHANHNLPFCTRFRTYALAKAMKSGALPEPSKGDFWKARWTPPRMPTADLKGMGRLMIDLRKACLTTYEKHFEELGLDYEDELEQCAKEAREMIDLETKYNLPPGTLTGSLVQPGQVPPGAADPNAAESTAPAA